MPKLPSIVLALFSLTGFSAAAQTNFGSVNVGSSATATVTITMPSAAEFTTIKVVTMGQTGHEFAGTGTGTCATGVMYAAGQTCTVGVAFNPQRAGLRMGAVSLTNSSARIYVSSYVQGTGAGPQLAFNPGLATATDPELNGTGLGYPVPLAVDGTDTIFTADFATQAQYVIKAPSNNGTVSTITPMGTAGDYVDPVYAIAIDGAGNRIIAGTNKHSGGPLAVRIPTGAGAGVEYNDPSSTSSGTFTGVAVDGAGDLFLVNGTHIIEFPATPSNAAPVYFTPAPGGVAMRNPYSLAVDAAGNIFTADTANDRVVEVPAGGGAAIAITPTVNGKQIALPYPTGVAVDGVGDLYISDTGRIVEVPVGGGAAIAIQPVVNGIGISPIGLAFDSGGNLFIADHTDQPYMPEVGRIVEVMGSQSSLGFAIAHVGSNSPDSPQTVQVQNVGTSSMNLASPEYGMDFPEDTSGTSLCTASTSLSTGQTCNLAIDFRPETAGYKSESLFVFNSAYSELGKVSLTGTGTYVQLSAYSLAYGSQEIGTSTASQQVTLTNGDTSALAINSIKVTGANATSFVFGNTCPASLPAGQSCTIHGHFAPASAGSLSAAVTITDNQPDSPQSIALTGTGLTPPTATLSSTSLSYGNQSVGTSSASQYVNLTNNGQSPLSISGITVTGPDASSFVFGNTCGGTVAAGGGCQIHGHFTPATTGSLSATVTITDNAGGSPQTIALTGTGQ